MNDFVVKNRVPLMIALWVGLLIFFIYSYVQAVETVAQGKSKLPEGSTPPSIAETIISSGSASILRNEDIEEAKGKALKTAKDEAMLKMAGLHVSSEILTKERDYLLKGFEPERDNIITEYKIISEDSRPDGFYEVKISAKVREDIIKSILMKNLYDDRAIVITSERNLGKSIQKHILEHELIKRIKEKGYFIVDYRTINNDTVRDLVSSVRQGNTEAVKKIGIYYLTDVVVVGFVESKFSQQTKEIYSANATGQIKIHQIGGKKEISSLTKHNIKGFGSDGEKAGLDAIRKLSVELAEESIKNLPKNNLKRIKLSIKEIGNYASLRKAKHQVSNIPYVKEVRDGLKDFDIEEATLYLRTTKGIDYIARRITELNLFVVKRVGQSEITLEARKI